jgi:hypothetical protein
MRDEPNVVQMRLVVHISETMKGVGSSKQLDNGHGS